MSLQIDLIRCCLKCGMVGNFAEPNGLANALASQKRTVTSQKRKAGARSTAASVTDQEASLWRQALSLRLFTIAALILVLLYLVFWGTSKLLHVNEDEAMKMIRGPQYEEEKQDAPSTKMSDPLEDPRWRRPNDPRPNTLYTDPDSLGECLGWGTMKGEVAARSRHPQGVNLLLADGSVRFISDHIDEIIWRSLATREGAELLENKF